MTQAEKVRRFRALHDGPGAFVIPNPYDIGTARILAGLGFKALATTSAGFAFTIGRQDGAVTREQALAHSGDIVAATDLPVSADLENCFGDDPETVAETVRLAAGVGLAGCSVEDYGGDGEQRVYDFGHAVDRVRAAVEAARGQPFPFVLTARAENFLRGRPDLDDTIRRLVAFAEAGADVLYAPALPDLPAIEAVCQAVAPKPVNVLCAGRRTWTVAELAAVGVRRISVGSGLAHAALGAFLRAAREMAEQGSFGFTQQASSSAEINGFMAGR